MDEMGKYSEMQQQSPRRVLKKGVLRNFAKSTGKHLCQSLFFNIVAGLHLFLKNTSSGCFCTWIYGIFKTRLISFLKKDL